MDGIEKPIWVFAGRYYYAQGGLQNLIGRFDTLEEAELAIADYQGESEWYQIVDVKTCTLLRQNQGGGHGSRSITLCGQTCFMWPVDLCKIGPKAIKLVIPPTLGEVRKLQSSDAIALNQGFDMKYPPDCHKACYWSQAKHGMNCPDNGCPGTSLRS